MLGIGSTEFVIILFFGFLIFGPEKLPEMGRVVGRAIRQFRQASDDVNKKFKEDVYDPFQDAIDPYKSEIDETFKPIKEDIDSINESFKDVQNTLKDPLDLKGKRETNPLKAAQKADAEEKAAKAAAEKEAAAQTGEKKVVTEGVAIDDPFANATTVPVPETASASIAASLYGLDDDDDEEGGEE